MLLWAFNRENTFGVLNFTATDATGGLTYSVKLTSACITLRETMLLILICSISQSVSDHNNKVGGHFNYR